MKIFNRLLLLLLLSTLGVGCQKTYYWYSYEATKRLPTYSFWFNSDGTTTPVLRNSNPLILPDGTEYTAVFYDKKGAKQYLWPDKKLVKVVCTDKETLDRNKRIKQMLK
jgi:hypothetical protein